MHSKKHFILILYLAIGLHAALIFGVYFTPEDRTQSATTLEVTLATKPSLSAPKKADYLSDSNQQGSGLAKEKHIPKKYRSPHHAAPLSETSEHNNASSKVVAQAPSPTIITAPIAKTQTRATKGLHPKKPSTEHLVISANRLQSEIDRLQGQLTRQREIEAKRPRIYYGPSVASKQDIAARYKYAWREKVERIGNLHYPQQARRNQLHGQLRLLVAIRANGSLYEVKVMHSSGIAVLDRAAIGIVRLAAPYPPFHGALKKRFDRLEMIRTWRFEEGQVYNN